MEIRMVMVENAVERRTKNEERRTSTENIGTENIGTENRLRAARRRRGKPTTASRVAMRVDAKF
jgi:hypothetical protein